MRKKTMFSAASKTGALDGTQRILRLRSIRSDTSDEKNLCNSSSESLPSFLPPSLSPYPPLLLSSSSLRSQEAVRPTQADTIITVHFNLCASLTLFQIYLMFNML